MNNKTHCIWIFGMPNSGKTTTAYNLMQKKLRNYILIDGDKFRRSRTPSLEFTREDILLNNRNTLQMVKYLMSTKWNMIVSMITPYVEMREEIKKELGTNCIRIMLTCDEKTRKERKNFFESDIKFEEGGFDMLINTNIYTEEWICDHILKTMQQLRWIE